MLGIHLNLAPVVDLRCPDGLMGREGRCLGDEAERVSTLARIYTEGLVSWGVGGCLKHFPGIGAVPQDTRQELPVLDLDSGSLDLHVSVFASLSEMVPVVMMAHVVVPSLGDTERPASLSPAAVERAASLPGSPVVISDDLEMGALDAWGDLPDRVVHALRARNHGILVSTAFDRLSEIAFALRSEAETDDLVAGRIAQTEARLGTLRRDLCQRFAALPAPDEATVEQLWERARREAES
jgi:beta-N-acetylhexosaminidase